MKEFFSGRIIAMVMDITEAKADAIVNAANSTLMGGGGVDGAIHRRGGPDILNECKRLRDTLYPDGLPPGEAVLTGAGNLYADYVIHTVGPVWSGGGSEEERILSNCYINSLELAKQENLESIAFPAISTGVYGYPKDKAALTALESITSYLEKNSYPEKVYLIFYSENDYNTFLDSV